MKIQQCLNILELNTEISPVEVKRAYKDMVNIWHPDRFSGNPRLKKKAERKLKEINLAYETLESHLSSGKELNLDETDFISPSRNRETRDKTEAIAEASTLFILNTCSSLFRALRGLTDSQNPKRRS